MPEKIYIGIDNGASGSIGIVGANLTLFYPTPSFSQLDYQKKKHNTTRVDWKELYKLLRSIQKFGKERDCQNILALVERPMVNPGRFTATKSALRALEATLITLERCDMAYEYIDSRQWQKIMLPAGLKGSAVLKKASQDVGRRLFPDFGVAFRKQKDADGILIAEWARKTNR